MNFESLKKVLLDELGGEADGDSIAVPSERKVTVLVQFGDETLRVARVQSVRTTSEFVNLVGETAQFFVDPMSVFAIKSEDSAGRREARPGFH